MSRVCDDHAKSSVVRAQEFACVEEATLAEKVLNLSKELQASVAGVINLFDKHWPAGLGAVELLALFSASTAPAPSLLMEWLSLTR